MKNAKKNVLSPLARLSMPARIAVIATAVLLLAAIVFGIVWSLIDHSYRYDKVDLGQFFAEGKNPFDYKTLEGLKKLPIKIETELTEAKVLDQIETNLKGIPNVVATYGKKAANLTSTIAFPDIAYVYYEVYKPTETEGTPDTLLISNTSYVATPANNAALTQDNAAAGATVVRLGSGKLNALLEKWMQTYPEFGTSVHRVLDKDTVVEDGYTYVIDVKGEYKTTTKDADGNDKETTKTYVGLTNYYYQPKDVPEGKSYYSGNEKVLTDKTAYDSSVKKADADLVAKVNEEAAKLTKIGEEVKIEMDAKIDTGSDTYPTTVTITLKAAFLAEQKIAVIDLGEDDALVDKDGNKLAFTYKDAAAGKDVTIDTGKLNVRITLETVLSLDKATVSELTADIEGFEKPNVTEGVDEAYAARYVLYVKDDMMADAIEKVKKSTGYLSTIRSTLWHEIVDLYALNSNAVTSLPEDVYEELYEDTMEYHEEMYRQQYTASYTSLEEYILKAVYDDEEATKLSAAAQAEKVDEYISQDLREAIVEKIVLFAIAERRGLEVSNREIRAYKAEYRESIYNTYLSYYKAIYGSTMSEGEIKIQCKDIAKESANAYEKTYYRECVMLRKVQELLVPFAIDFDGEITWTYQGEAGHEH